MLSGEEILLSSEDMVSAILASSAIPGALPPIERAELSLADGGVADDTALSQAVALGAEEMSGTNRMNAMVIDLSSHTQSEQQNRLGVVAPDRVIDRAATQRAVRDLLLALGQDPECKHLVETPRRVAECFAELSPLPFDFTTFPNDEEYDELVLARGIEFASLCEHHLLPFHGVAHVGYVLGDSILGLSKLARVVELFSHQLQFQERLTMQVADWLDDHLHPKAVGVVVEAEHLCMSLRGVRATGSRTVTSALRGLFRHDPRSRQEFLALTGGSRWVDQ